MEWTSPKLATPPGAHSGRGGGCPGLGGSVSPARPPLHRCEQQRLHLTSPSKFTLAGPRSHGPSRWPIPRHIIMTHRGREDQPRAPGGTLAIAMARTGQPRVSRQIGNV